MSPTVAAAAEKDQTQTHLDVGNDDVGRVDTDGDSSGVRTLNVDALDVDDPLLTVNLGDLALTSLVLATDNEDLVVLADRERLGLICACQLTIECISKATARSRPTPQLPQYVSSPARGSIGAIHPCL